jgi:hypothetical protein
MQWCYVWTKFVEGSQVGTYHFWGELSVNFISVIQKKKTDTSVIISVFVELALL